VNYLLDGTGQKFYDLGNMGGTQGVPNRTSGGFAGRHGLAETVLNDALFRRTVASGRTYQEFSFLNNFKFTNTVAIDFQTQNDASYENTLVGDGAPAGRSRRTFSSSVGLVATQLLNYGRSFGGAHKVDALVGHESFNDRESSLDAFKQGQSLSGNSELGNFTTINSAGSSVDKYRVESYFSRVNYDYRSKYFISGSIRRDGNSRFATESRWGTFWSVGGGWKIDKEKFMRDITWIESLKLRGSYGVVGNADGIGFYAYQGLYVFANNANEPGIVQSQTSSLNRTLSWEKNKQFDIGIDFSLFKGRVNGSVEYYNRGSSDLLFAVPQALSSGILTVNKNTATMNNKGVELQLNGDIIRSKTFTWNMNVNLSTVKNEITKMPEGIPEFVTGTKKYSVGQSIFGFWLRTYYGVDPADGSALYVADNTSSLTGRRIIANKAGGNDTVTTVASNGKFEYHGSSIPDLYGSFTESFSYQGFTLNALFTFQLGGKTFDANYQGLMSSGTYGGALSTEVLGRWQKVGDITNVPRMDAGRTTDFNATSSRWLIDGSYFNIRTISLSYALPKNFLSRMKINSSQVFVSAENVAFFSKRKGLNNQQAFSGVTSNAYPPARVISAGINLNF
jgi:TonB-linked SusC/RagA family outer membrane protein